MRFDTYLKEQLTNEAFKKEYDALEPEFQVVRAMLDARMKQDLTQRELAERIGIDRSDISRLENGTANPSLKMLKRIAEGLGMRLKIEFIPK